MNLKNRMLSTETEYYQEILKINKYIPICITHNAHTMIIPSMDCPID